MNYLKLLSFCSLVLFFLGCRQEKKEKTIIPVNFSKVEINDSFWNPILKNHKTATIGVCIDQIENQTGRMQNFENVAKKINKHSGIFYDDSDVYKALEGMAYTLKNNPDSALEAKCDQWISKFVAAQQEDGYINTYYTLNGNEERWTDMDRHEMYCAGHMFEAAVAYYEVTGKKELLEVSERMAQHMMSIFGPDKRHWVPGHEEIELALVKLYEVTGNKDYLDFAAWLLEERGHGYFVTKAHWKPEQFQDAVPVSEMTDITGHAVRLMYLCCGMADVAAYTDNKSYFDALNRIWEDVVERNMYITGGIGSSGRNEGFTYDYDLPNKEAYCETCASIGMVFWNWRMNLLTGDSKYINVLERSLFNGVLAGISQDCSRFFYVNPLESDGNHHRQAWYGTACCPSNVCRFLPSIGNYAYGCADDTIYVNLFMGCETEFDGMKVRQSTEYPWSGKVDLVLSGRTTSKTFRIRVPQWCKSYQLSVNGESAEYTMEKGYLQISRKWNENDIISFNMDMPVKMVKADDRVEADRGKRAIQRGPVVFCLEAIDNNDVYENARLDSKTSFDVTAGFPKGVVNIIAKNSEGTTYKYIPYYAWDNREPSAMKVWTDYID